MAFERSNFGLLGAGLNSNHPRLWSYFTTDTAATCDTAGYFNAAKDLLKVGDIIKVNADTGGTPAYVELYVNANDGTTVDTSDAVSIVVATDTD